MFNLKCIYNFNNYFCILCLLHWIMLLAPRGTVEAQKLSAPAADFSRHRVVQPVVHHGRTKREITSTRDTSGVHHSEVTMKVPIDDRELVLDLQLNKDLITDNHVLRYQEGGKTVIHKPTKEDIDLCQYSGTVRGMPGSWVAVSTCYGVRGVIFDGEQTRFIEPAEGEEIQSQHYVYDNADLKTNDRHGNVDGVTNNTSYGPLLLKKHFSENEGNREPSRVNRYKRSAEDKKIRGPYNANERSRYVELVLVADNRGYRKSGRDLRRLHHKLKDLANIINSVYAPLNIFIALVGVEVWTQFDKIKFSKDSEATLNKFLEYRASSLVLNLPNDNAHLLTQQSFDQDVVGKAGRGSICSHKFSGGIATDHTTVIGLVAATIAHEMGHNFDMDHDGDDCECPDKKCIMNRYSNNIIPTKWSSCSLKYLASGFEKGLDICLRNKPKSLFESPTCGNGFVEPGEQCDCGTAAEPGAASPCHACCQPDTCMLRRNATCATGACCDLQKCQPRSAGTQCRRAERECDLPEYCTGDSEFCPDDVYKMDTTPCGRDDHRAYCVSGRCRSRLSQCQLLWGPTGRPTPDICYTQYNGEGTSTGNCGYDRLKQRYRRCLPQDARCGTLHCEHLTNRVAWGRLNPYIRYTYAGNGVQQCHSIILYPKESEGKLGLVPDGAGCGDEMMCMQQRCVSLAALRARIAARESSVCPSNCSGHGVCNSEGQCHCEAGFSPPLCALPGAGGSHDSGPATDPTITKYVMVAIYVIFLGIVPAVFLIFLIYYFRRDLALWWRRADCRGCLPNTKGTKRTVVNTFRNTSSSIRHLLTFKSNAPKAESTDRTNENRGTIETKINVTKTDGDNSTKMLASPIVKINKCDIQIVSPPSFNDEHIYANINANTKRHSHLKILEKTVTKINKVDKNIIPTVSKEIIYANTDIVNTKLDTRPKMLQKPTTDTNTKIDIKPKIVKKPINNDIQIPSGIMNAQFKLKPTPKPVLSKENRPTMDNLESTNPGTVSNIRRMFDTGNVGPCTKNDNLKVHRVKK